MSSRVRTGTLPGHPIAQLGNARDGVRRKTPGAGKPLELTLSRLGLGGLGHGAIAHDAMKGIAVRIGPRLGKFVTQIDELMIDERKRLVMQRRFDRLDDVVHLLLAAGPGPHMQGQEMLRTVFRSSAPVAEHALAEADEGKARRLGRIVVDPGAAEQSPKLGGICQRLVDAALQRPTCACRHREVTINHWLTIWGGRACPSMRMLASHDQTLADAFKATAT